MKPKIKGRPHLYVSEHPEYFEDDILKFEENDDLLFDKQQILFVGSSNICKWAYLLDMQIQSFRVLNRGIIGTQMSHLIYYYDRLIPKHNPRAIVVQAGGNDLEIETGKTANTVHQDFEKLVGLIHSDLPETPVYFLAISPSILRWDRWGEMCHANELIENTCQANPLLTFVDVATPLLNTRSATATPEINCFQRDYLHLSSIGYMRWAEVLKPVLLRDLG